LSIFDAIISITTSSGTSSPLLMLELSSLPSSVPAAISDAEACLLLKDV
jgi:hypothetical protein